MLYDDYVKTVQGSPFSTIDPTFVVDNSLHSMVIPARSPYTIDHLLIIPKREVTFQYELSHEEVIDLYILMDKRLRKLHTKHGNVSILLRDCNANSGGKSVNHLHIHLIPNFTVDAPNPEGGRRFFSHEEFDIICHNIRQEYIFEKEEERN